MNILFLNKLNDYWHLKFEELKAKFPSSEFVNSYDPNERAELLSCADVVICGRLSAEEIKSSPNLKAVFVPFTGLNNFPLELIKSKGIVISNTHANARFVAEHAVALAFAILGRVAEFHNDLAKGYWHRSIEGEDMWQSVQGMNIGIIGYGHIGSFIAKFLKSFGCRVIGVNRNGKHRDENADEITTDLSYTIEKSEILFLTLPLTDKTMNLISHEYIKKMKGKYIINVGRGETLNELDLYNALKDGTLAGAALDVWYNYPGKNPEPVMPFHFPFNELPNVVLSPHKSSHAIEAVNAMIDDTCHCLGEYIKTMKSPNTVRL